MIVTQDLSKRFNGFLAVDGVTLQVSAGEVLALLGPNGAGKTTTVRMLTSILCPTSGWAQVAGFDVVKQPASVRASVGILTEHHSLYDRMPADEYLDFFAQLYGLSEPARRKRINTLIEQFGLGSYLKLRTGKYSKGMRQKLALARALLHDPPVLLLDEPTSAMDPESARLVRDSIRALRSAERTIVICTHNLAEAEELSDRIAIIRHGRIIVKGPPTALKLALLGPVEYEVRLACSPSEWPADLPESIHVTAQGPDWLRYQTNEPELVNPPFLQFLLSRGLPVVCLQEAPRSLEQVYLRVIAAPDEMEGIDVE